MAGENQVGFEIAVETDGAIKSLSNLEKTATATAQKVGSAFDGLKGIAAAALAVFAGHEVIGFFKEGIDGAIAQQQAFAKLETQLKATGENSAEATAQFADLSDELEKNTKFSDDAIISSAALAKAYGLTNNQAIDLTKAAADLASVTGESLESAVTTLSESYAGNVKSLQKLVPEVKALTKEQLAAGGAVDIIGKRFKGAANDEIKTYKGAIIQAGNAFENFQKSIGKIVVDNKSLTTAIGGLNDVFGALQKFVEDNADAINTGLNFAVRAFIASVDAATQLAGGFVVMLGTVADTVLEFSKATIDGLLPVAHALDALTLDDTFSKSLEDANAAILDTKSSVDKFVDTTATGMGSVANAVDDMSQKVFDAGEVAKESGKKGADAQEGHRRGIIKSAEEVARLGDAYKKFLDGLQEKGASDSEKIFLEAKKNFDELEKLHKENLKAGLKDHDNYFKGLVLIGENASKAQIKLQEDTDKKLAEEAKKAAEEIRAEIEKAGHDPIKFVIQKLDIPPLDMKVDDAKLASAGAGFIGKMLDGAAGAKSLISNGAAAFADALVPGLGGAVGGVVAKLAEGPEATKKFIREFIDAIPDIMDAVGEATPAVVEALVDSMINKGGALRIGVATARAMAGEGILKSLGKQLGIDMGSAFHADVIAKKISDSFSTAGEGFIAQLNLLFSNIFVEMPKQFLAAATSFLSPIAEFFAETLPQNVLGAFAKVFDWFFTSLPSAIFDAFSQAYDFFTVTLPSTVFDSFKPAFDFFNKFPSLIYDSFKPVFDFFSNLGIDTSGGGLTIGGKKYFAGGGVIGAANGAIISPRGLDNIPVLAQRGEMILNSTQQADLFGMIKNGGSDRTSAIMEQVLKLLQSPQVTNVQATVNGKAFADISLQQSRQRARLTA